MIGREDLPPDHKEIDFFQSYDPGDREYLSKIHMTHHLELLVSTESNERT